MKDWDKWVDENFERLVLEFVACKDIKALFKSFVDGKISVAQSEMAETGDEHAPQTD